MPGLVRLSIPACYVARRASVDGIDGITAARVTPEGRDRIDPCAPRQMERFPEFQFWPPWVEGTKRKEG
jgi:hypothetical protein